MIEEEVKRVFKGEIIGREIIFFPLTSSTNDKAMEIAEKLKNPEGIVLVADAQERGRGRLGRKWVSPPGVNLYFTVLLTPPFPPKEASLLTLMSALAVASAIKEYTGLNATLKWPNDILIGGKKLGGILLEMRSEMQRIIFVAIGIGVNVNLTLDMLPEDIRGLSTSLREEKGEPIDRVRLLRHILSSLQYYYKILLGRDKKVLIDEWLRLDSTLGNKVSVQTPGSIISGIAEGIDDDGALILRLPSGATEKVYGGDVTILKGSS